MTRVSSWGRLTQHEHDVSAVYDRGAAVAAVSAPGMPGIAAGLERSYGDVSLNGGGRLWDVSGMDRFISFDEATGSLRCEAGATISDIQEAFSARGWMMPVTPGTRFVTIGGAIANDVHGKNHHRAGSIGNHVTALTLLRSDGAVIECSPTLEPDWFAATVGGMGLTGVILEATITLAHTGGPWIDAEDIVFESLEEFYALSAESDATHDYAVSWVDVTTGGGRRGIFTRGNSAVDQSGAAPKDGSIPFPITPPISLVNSASVPIFNRAYFRTKAMRAGSHRVHYRPFFYPLDSIRGWNRMYGPRGFHQYQSVVPPESGAEATALMLREISTSGLGSFLGVLKTFGHVPPVGMMSFPMPGITFALDFPERGRRTEALFERLDRIVSDAGGRLYAAKDARMPRNMFEAGYPELDRFRDFVDPGISSELYRRLMGTQA
jgi:FAD/FMN-containing dehydrogenase